MVTKKDKKEYAVFRKNILRDGFRLFQFSTYTRYCLSESNAQTHLKRVKSWLPPKGKVALLTLTDSHYAAMEIYNGPEREDDRDTPQQLEIF